jgi:hypothetical protein
VALGNWAYDHQDFMRHNPLGYLPYQYVRSAIASIPYGIGAALAYKGLRTIAPEAGRSVDKWESGFKAALQIGASFTFYRTFSKAAKATFEDVFDPQKSREEVQEAVSHAGQTFWSGVRNELPAEAESVPWGAFTLGYITQLHKPMAAEAVAAAKKDWKMLVAHPGSSLLQNCAVNTVAYGTFFEVSGRLAKDYKRRHGQEVAEDKKPVGDYEFFTHGMGSLFFKKVLPVAAGISAYTVAKRYGYRMGGGAMDVNKGILTNAWREGFATSFFFTLLSCTEPWANAYDRFFENLKSKRDGALPAPEDITPQAQEAIARNFEKLDEQLRDKEQVRGRA